MLRAALIGLVLLTATSDARTPKKPPIAKKSARVPPVKAPPKELSAVDAAIALRFYNSMMDMIAASKGDCGAMAANINFVIDQNRELVRMLVATNAAGIQMPPAVTTKMMERVKDVMPILQKCMNHPDVMDAFQRMDKPEKQQQPIQ